VYWNTRRYDSVGAAVAKTEPAAPLWKQTLTTSAKLSSEVDEAYVLDSLTLPKMNPWKRNLRLADLAFLNDQGDAAAVSFDGDIWLLSGLKGDLESVTWRRYTSGLHEPMSIVAREGKLYVFDRNGVWTFADDNGDGEADRHEMFCNRFSQTAETREFPNSMKLGPDGSLYVSKGGQEGTTFGKHNGTVLRIKPDGSDVEVIGYGLRQPFIGVNPKTGLVTASDQQGHYVPSTPLHIVEKGKFYGHLPTIAPKEKYPADIAEPLTWIPHPVNPSGATQVWLQGAKLGPIDDELMHIGYNRPELFRVLVNERFSRPQAAVMSFNRDLDFGPLNAHVNPADGQLYVIGFQVWGTTAKQLSGIARLRYTDKPRVLLKEVTPTDKGLLLRFNAALEPKLATDPANYTAERWNYKRTPEYGSPHLKPDGSNGQEWITPSSAYLSSDGKCVMVGIPGMTAGVHQMRIGWGLASADGLPAKNTAYFSPWELATFDSDKEGFGKITVDLTPRAALATAVVKPTAVEGARLAEMYGCMACHSIDGTTVGKVGPSWKGIFGSERDIAKGKKGKVKADETYIRESILSPSAKVVRGFEKFDTGMPIYAGILNDNQIDSIILYLKQLK
jgi:cytochrome c2